MANVNDAGYSESGGPMRISEILRSTGGEVATIDPGADVRALLSLLAEHNIGAVVVSTDGETIEGIVSERHRPAPRRARRGPARRAGLLDHDGDRAHLRAERPGRGPPRHDDRTPHPSPAGRPRREAHRHRQHR